jgi:capsular exopolysaccharide synthesis family protein
MDQTLPVRMGTPLLQKFLAAIIGLIVGLGIVGLLATRDDRFTSVADLKLHLPEKLVGQIPDVSAGRRNGSLQLLEPQDPRHTFAESYRAVRSSVLFMSVPEGRPRTILVTSAMPSEGKSTVAANLARSLAFAGSRVLLVDGDLRTGKLHELFGLPCEPGLNQICAQDTESANLPVSTSVPNLFFIPRGKANGHCGELFLHPAIDRLLSELSTAFDYVLIDSAPVFAAADTLSLAPKVDGVIFVVRDWFTRANLAREAISQLNQLEARVLGIIFNRANGSAARYQYFENNKYHEPVATV